MSDIERDLLRADNERLRGERRRLRRRIAELTGTLKAVEWHRTSVEWNTKTTDVCPSCGNTEAETHAPQCQLATTLRRQLAPPQGAKE